jgi:hypothetical protein
VGVPARDVTSLPPIRMWAEPDACGDVRARRVGGACSRAASRAELGRPGGNTRCHCGWCASGEAGSRTINAICIGRHARMFAPCTSLRVKMHALRSSLCHVCRRPDERVERLEMPSTQSPIPFFGRGGAAVFQGLGSSRSPASSPIQSADPIAMLRNAAFRSLSRVRHGHTMSKDAYTKSSESFQTVRATPVEKCRSDRDDPRRLPRLRRCLTPS